jgi:chaperonin cofactor prefoldin
VKRRIDMKKEDLTAIGLTDEQITKVQELNGKDVNKVITERDNYKTQLDTAQTTLKGFEGVDVTNLKGKITQLTNDLTVKDAQYKNELADRDFNDLVKTMATELKARDVKAVMPFLDVEKLKTSKNQKDDLKSAFEEVKKSNDYLFLSDKPTPRVVSTTSGPNQDVDDKKTQANEAFRSLFGKE